MKQVPSRYVVHKNKSLWTVLNSFVVVFVVLEQIREVWKTVKRGVKHFLSFSLRNSASVSHRYCAPPTDSVCTMLTTMLSETRHMGEIQSEVTCWAPVRPEIRWWDFQTYQNGIVSTFWLRRNPSANAVFTTSFYHLLFIKTKIPFTSTVFVFFCFFF